MVAWTLLLLWITSVYSVPRGGEIPWSIIGGEPVTDVNQFPWTVVIKQNGEAICGGSMISSYAILTAAHCTPDANQVGVHLTAESRRNNLGISAKKEGAIQFKVLKTINHPDYQDNDTPIHDIAVWIVKSTNLRQNKTNIPIIPLSNSTRIYHGTKLAISGWGLTSDDFDGQMSDVLMHAQVPWVSMKKCQSVLGDKVSENQICAGYDQGGVDSCSGDSGGPLMYWNPISQKHILVGVTSWGEGCAQPFAYGVYTKVSTYFDWIMSVIHEYRPQKQPKAQFRHKRQRIY